LFLGVMQRWVVEQTIVGVRGRSCQVVTLIIGEAAAGA